MPLFEVAILLKPSKKEAEEGTGTEKLIFGPECVVARDDQSACISAVMDGNVPRDIDRTRMEVLVRPFA